ncbi:MAG TPA: hypothetical protein DEF36_13615 [Desulfotomaculum sp.]|nr:hypothetical protein [Desulfotomaculum sp.]
MKITMTINNIKNIDYGEITIPIENDIYAVVGNNGTGKSTIMSCLAQLISRHNLGLLRKEDHGEGSYISFETDKNKDVWTCTNNFWRADTFPHTNRFNGTYEGSLFYGMRFIDSKIVDELMQNGKIEKTDIVDADIYIIDHLGEIVYGDKNRYSNLKRLRNKIIRDRLGLRNTPYFIEVNSQLISQYRMSSGECLLVSLLHFIYNSLVRRSLPTNEPILMLIDEIELALHPTAIMNLIKLLEELVESYDNLTVILTSHSPEVIRKIKPRNIFKLETDKSEANSFIVSNPCYPSYAIRDIYTHDGFDYLLLVEDELAKIVVKKALEILELENSRLVNVLPVGGWNNVLKMQFELLNNNILGVGKMVFSILDGDVQSLIKKEHKSLRKLFLPINSIEKYLKKVLIETVDTNIKKKINDIFFNVEPIDNLIREYLDNESSNKSKLGNKYKNDDDGKRFYEIFIKRLNKKQITEQVFILKFYEIIEKYVDFTSFYERLTDELT